MNLDELKRRVAEIFELQRERMFIVVGLYLPAGLLDLLRPELDPDEPAVGAVGRFDRVPVYAESALVDAGPPSERASHGGIRFTYVQMDVVD